MDCGDGNSNGSLKLDPYHHTPFSSSNNDAATFTPYNIGCKLFKRAPILYYLIPNPDTATAGVGRFSSDNIFLALKINLTQFTK